MKEELGKDGFRKLIRRISIEGVVFQVQDDGVVNFFCLDNVDDKQLLGMRGQGWLVYKGLEDSSKQLKHGDTEARDASEVDVQKKKGYSRKYGRKHKQAVRVRNSRVV